MKGMNNILMFAIVGVGAYYFIVKKDVLGIMSAGAGGGVDETGLTAGTAPGPEMQPTGSPNPAVPGASIYPPDVGGYYKGIEYPNLSAVFPTNPGVGYRPPAFRTNEELIGGGFFGIPPGSGQLNPAMVPGTVVPTAQTIAGVLIPAGYVFVGTDPATGALKFEEPDTDPTLPPDAKPGSVVVINKTQPFIDVISYIDRDGRHKEIKRDCRVYTRTATREVCIGPRGVIVRTMKKGKTVKYVHVKKKKANMSFHIA